MNDKTRIMYNLARMYEYAKDVIDICKQNEFDYESIVENTITKHATNMCIVQMGEHAARIRDVDMSIYRSSDLNLFQIKGMRDRITHAYGDIDYKIVKNVLKNDVPKIKKSIEQMVDPDIIENPYLLYEQEYDDYVNEKERMTQKEECDCDIKQDAMKKCMTRTAANLKSRDASRDKER